MAKLTQTKFAEHVGASRQAIGKLVQSGILDLGRGIDYARTQYCEHLREVAAGRQSSEADYDLTAERARLAHHQANNEALKEAQVHGDLLPAELVIELCSGLVGAARAKLLAVHNKIRNRFTDLPQETVDEIQQLHHEALEELGSDGLPPEIRRRIQRHIERMEAAAEPAD